MKHKWRLEGVTWVCGWCKNTLPNTPEGRALALGKRANGCKRMTQEAADAKADAIDLEVDAWYAGGKAWELSDEAARVVQRRHRHVGSGLLAALMLAAAPPRRF